MNTKITPEQAALLNIVKNHRTNISELSLEVRSILHSVLDAPPECDNAPVTRSCAAFLTSKSPAYLAVMASKGDYSLPFFRSGRSVFYTLKDIREYLKLANSESLAA